MRKLLLTLLLLPTLAWAAPVGIGWDPNPPAEGVTEYRVMAGDVILATTATTEADVDLAPGAHSLTVVACAAQPDGVGGTATLCSDPSAPLAVKVPGTPGGMKLRVTVTVEVTQ